LDGIARTVDYKGYRIDICGHRYFTKVKRVDTLWDEILGDEFLLGPRLSSICEPSRYSDHWSRYYRLSSRLLIERPEGRKERSDEREAHRTDARQVEESLSGSPVIDREPESAQQSEPDDEVEALENEEEGI